jgi:carbon monoxide dehydrogenase subunit G
VTKEATEFGGQERFAVAPEKVYGLLTDLDAMARTIPDLVSAEKSDDGRTLKCVVRPGFSFLRGTMRLAISLGDCQQPKHATMKVDAKGIGLAMGVISQLNIAEDGDGSLLEWSARVEELKGLISAVSPGLIRAAADQVIRHAWSEVRKELEQG